MTRNMGSPPASYGINIVQIHFSRGPVGGTAIPRVHVDGRVSPGVVEALRMLPHNLSFMQAEL